MHHNDDHHLIFMIMIIIISGLKLPALFVGPWFSSGQGTRLETPAVHPFRTRQDIGAWQRHCRPGEVFDSANNQRWLFPFFQETWNEYWINTFFTMTYCIENLDNVWISICKPLPLFFAGVGWDNSLKIGQVLLLRQNRSNERKQRRTQKA